eukprot:1140943-Pelagomonas_calceolata.AAC.4
MALESIIHRGGGAKVGRGAEARQKSVLWCPCECMALESTICRGSGNKDSRGAFVKTSQRQ